MITAKQRSYLKGIANKRKPLAQLGKEGISDAFVASMNDLLESHELIKVNVLDSSLLGSKEAAVKVAKRTRAEFVQAIGNKFVIYKRAQEDPKIELPTK